MFVSFGVSSSRDDLQQILNLQAQNLSSNISSDEAKNQGFVTVQHDIDLLERMNTPHYHTVARDSASDKIVGYALTMERSFQQDIGLAIDLCNFMDTQCKQDNESYVLMGQVCVAKEYRGKGVFRGLYTEMAARLQPHFDWIVTAVDLENTRSLNAHKGIGFETLKVHHFGGQEWAYLRLPVSKS